MWILPIVLVALAVGLGIPLGLLMARLLDRPAKGPVEKLLDTGPQDWKAYAFSLLGFNAAVFAVGFAILAFQHCLPLNPEEKTKPLAASMVFNTAVSFLTNTNLQHYSGEVHLSYFTQLFFVCWKQFVTPAIGLAALLAVIRGLRGDKDMGNFYVDCWRGAIHVLLPLSLIVGLILVASGVPMTLAGKAEAATLEGATQSIARGPVAAVVAIKQLGTNGGGFFGTNACHPFENPNWFTNIVSCVSILLVPVACVAMFGRMVRGTGQAAVVFGVMAVFLAGFIAAGVALDTGTANPAFKGLAVDSSGLGNAEGKELRFGASAGPAWAAITTCTSNGSVNCMHDSLNPLAGLVPLSGMWLNCIFGGVGVGLINFLVYLIVAVFLSGLMVGRTPEYLGKKVEAREMKLAMLALLIHPLLVLGPTALFAATGWAAKAASNPGAHGLTQTLYEFTSASANNGSGFEGLDDTVGFEEEAAKPEKVPAYWYDVATGLAMLLGRFVPIIAPLALAASLAARKPTPFTAGTLRTDTLTFGFVLFGTIVLVGALLFLPAAALGPIAEHASLPR